MQKWTNKKVPTFPDFTGQYKIHSLRQLTEGLYNLQATVTTTVKDSSLNK